MSPMLAPMGNHVAPCNLSMVVGSGAPFPLLASPYPLSYFTTQHILYICYRINFPLCRLDVFGVYVMPFSI